MKRTQIINNYLDRQKEYLKRLPFFSEKIDSGFNLSVIIPVYNEEKILSRVLLALQKQTYHHFEVVVVDNGSKDDTYNLTLLLRDKVSYPLWVLEEQNPGVANARKTGCDFVLSRLRTRLTKKQAVYPKHILVSTDADVIPPANWLEEINKKFKDIKSGALAGTHGALSSLDKKVEEKLGIEKFFNIIPEMIECFQSNNLGLIKMSGSNSAFEIESYAAAGGFIQEIDRKTGQLLLSETHRLGKRIATLDYPILPMGIRVIVSKRRQLYEILFQSDSYFPKGFKSKRSFYAVRENEKKLLKIALKKIKKELWLNYRENMVRKVIENYFSGQRDE